MSLTLEPLSTSPTSSFSDNEGFVMVTNEKSNSLPSSDVEVLKESLDKKSSSDSQVNVLPSSSMQNSRDNEVLGKLINLAKENEGLKETLKHNNNTLQIHINEIAEMQEQYKNHNESVKKEHQKAKEVVTKLRNENKSLKEQLKTLQLQNVPSSSKESGYENGFEQENVFLKQQIGFLQDQIAHIDKGIKDHQFTESAIESWQQLLGSIASHEYVSGTLFTGSSNRGIGEDAHSLEDRYAKLETEKEILNVDYDKMKLEKNHMEEQLLGLNEECHKLQTSLEHVKEEKDELQKMLNESYLKATESENEQKQLKEMINNLTAQVNSLKGKLQNAAENNSKIEKEKKEEAEKYQAQMKRMDEEFKQKILEMENIKKAGEDEEDDSVSKEKYESIKMLYLKYEGDVVKKEEENKKLQDELKTLTKEKEVAEKKLLESKRLMQQELESHSETYKEKLNQLHSELEEGRNREERHQEQIKYLLEEGEKRERTLQIELEKLQSTLNERGSTEESLQDQVCHLIQENDEMSVKIEKLTDVNARRDALYGDRLKRIEEEAEQKGRKNSGHIDILKGELGSSKEECKKYMEQCEVFKMEHERLATQHDSLMKEYNELLNSYNGTLEENRNKRINATEEIEDYQRQLDFLTGEQACYEEAMHKKDYQIAKLCDELEELRNYKDSVPVLKEQLEIYRNDFQAEREARERQHADLLQQQEENERLRLVNEDLQRDLDNSQMAEMQRRHGSHVPHVSVIGPGTSPSFRNGFFRRGGEPDPSGGFEEVGQRGGYAEQAEEPYPCHGCRENFAHFNDLQAHVRGCAAALRGSGPPHPGAANSQPSCPKCGNEFPDLDTLQIHVLECLDS